MKKLTVISDFEGMRHFLPTMLREFANSGFDVVGIDYGQLTFRDSNCKVIEDCSPIFVKLIKKIPKLRVLFKFIYPFLLGKMIRRNGDTDITLVFYIHRYVTINAQLIGNNSKKVILLYAGSDFYRVSTKDKNKHVPLLDIAHAIVCITSEFRKNLFSYFTNPKYSSKSTVIALWIPLLKVIKDMKESSTIMPFPRTASTTIVVTIGYNGKRAQQHIKILEAIQQTKVNLDDIVIVIPATYGLSQDYKNEMIVLLKSYKFNYIIIEDYLSEIDMASLRIRSDIVINIQTTDVGSASLVEHIAGGGVLIVGDWLPYKHWKDMGLHYHESSIVGLNKVFDYCVQNIESEKIIAEKNIEITQQYYNIENVLPKWIELFQK